MKSIKRFHKIAVKINAKNLILMKVSVVCRKHIETNPWLQCLALSLSIGILSVIGYLIIVAMF